VSLIFEFKMWRVFIPALITLSFWSSTSITATEEVPIPSLDLTSISINNTINSTVEYNYNETEVISSISSIIESSDKSNVKSKKKAYKSKFMDYIKSRNYKKQEYSELIKNNKKSKIEDKFELFVTSEDYINELNANLSDPMYGHTKYSDWTMDEKKSILMTQEEMEEERRRMLTWCNSFKGWGSGVTSSADYRWAAQAVQDQGDCGSCWAFSSIGQFEFNYYKYKGIWQKQSEQYVLDCVGDSIGNCDGGWPHQTNMWLADYGSCPQSNYWSYDGLDTWSCSSCWGSKTTTTNAAVACITESSTGYDTESYNYWKIIANAAQYVSLSFWMGISNSFYYVKTTSTSSSVTAYYYNCDASNIIGYHAMSTYGVSSTGNYLLVRNSWGTDFGDGGYFWLYYNSASTCNLQNYVSFNYWY
jgi:C1A family cysteine protease